MLNNKVERLFSYVNLVMNADTTNHKAIKYASILEDMLATFADKDARVKKWVGSFDFQQFQDQYIL